MTLPPSPDSKTDPTTALSEFQAVGELLRTELGRLTQVLATAGEQTQAYGRTLSAASGQLGPDADPADVQTLINGLIKATRLMEQHSRVVETQLKQSNAEVDQLRDRVEHIRRESLTDPLTQLPNRKAFDNALTQALAHAEHSREAFALIMADVDHFKTFNDTWGHQTGDQVLRLVGRCLTDNLKGRDTPARYGGEEFGIVLPGTSLANAAMLADAIRHAVEGRRIVKRSSNQDLGNITLSLGVSAWQPGDTADTLIQRADGALYAAKRSGRNRVVTEAEVSERDVDVAEPLSAAR